MFDVQMWQMIWAAFGQTVTMVLWSTLFSVILGLIPAVLLTLTAPDGLRPNRPIYSTLSFIVAEMPVSASVTVISASPALSPVTVP